MSSTNGGWKPRKTETLTLNESGQVVQIRRPGPEFTLKAARVVRTFTAKKANEVKQQPGETIEEAGVRTIAEMSDEELAALTIFARELVCAMLVSPKLVLNPNPDRDEIGPDDIGNDFWELFNYGMTNFYNLRVPVGNDAEVEVKDLESFRAESGVSGASVDGAHVPRETIDPFGDPGRLDSAGA